MSKGKNIKIKDLSTKQLLTIIKESVNRSIKEISKDTYARTAAKMRTQGQENRAVRLGNTFFRQFIGKPLLQGTIENIYNVDDSVHIHYTREDKPGSQPGYEITYLINNDLYPGLDKDYGDPNAPAISRKDARILSLIATKMNPNSRYAQPGQAFKIEGY